MALLQPTVLAVLAENNKIATMNKSFIRVSIYGNDQISLETYGYIRLKSMLSYSGSELALIRNTDRGCLTQFHIQTRL